MPKLFISIREIADDKTCISSTRWAFATIIKFDILIVFITIIAGLLSYFLPNVDVLDSSFYGNVAILLGVLTGVTGTAKALQGFEPHSKSDNEVMKSIKKDCNCQSNTILEEK